MRQKFYIHIGMGKTGTSSIQTFFDVNRDAFKRRGVYYPITSRVNHAHLICNNDFERISLKKQIFNWKKLIREGKKSSCEKVVISCEMLAHLPEQSDIFQIAELFAGEDVTIVCYIRRIDTLLQSQYVQGLKRGAYLYTPDEYVSLLKGRRMLTLDWWAEAFGDENVILKPFEKSALKGDLVEDFLDCLGEKLHPEYERIKSSNISPKGETLAAMIEVTRMVKAGLLDPDEGKYLNRSLQEMSHLFSWSKKRIQLFSREQILSSYRAYEPKYKEFARRFLGRRDGVLFQEPLVLKDASSEEDLQLDREALLRLLLGAQLSHRKALRSMPRRLPRYYFEKVMEKCLSFVGGEFKARPLEKD
ncbi:hypothetical protein [Desulfovibrio oxyclinae]|uniref:hypothetical protein n=1 Tax=Desulfovibrio oxyclinae TaxID=63560 RepID=UPI00037FA0C8|nr:hypothetical protein [Desulfovibrio oxyclinae]